ncbi:hypothetical protein [Kutzneria buriramensis]|uniref:Uncharacterized protein n=1 Tax=Kutzneria buriramensis TaxID=1045776 RepID=A0A3E0HPT5_9PSEU|nr:hypothetical protein [Kutzneria buriramensis]REH48428.1 hypothetical protein BCF44_105287 [Kutzneria buriramensis]
MNTRNLATNLQYIGLPATTVVVGGLADDHHCIMRTEDDQWEVFFYERGEKRHRVVVATEDVACTYIFGLLAHSQVLSERLVLAD